MPVVVVQVLLAQLLQLLVRSEAEMAVRSVVTRQRLALAAVVAADLAAVAARTAW